MSDANDTYPIRLDHVFFTRSVVVAVPDHVAQPNQALINPINTLNTTQDPEHPRRYTVTMHTQLNPEGDIATPYTIDMECYAYFEHDGTLPEAEAVRGITINGHSVCYGAIREAVAWLTSRQPYGSLMLGMSVLRSKPAKEAGETPEA